MHLFLHEHNATVFFLQDLREHFELGFPEIAVIDSATVGIYNMVGPVIGLTVNRIGSRMTCLLGALLCCVSMVSACFLNQHYWTFLLLYGVLNGFGLGALFLPANTSCSLFFRRRKGTAIGFATCGTGAGIMAMPPIAR